MADKKRPDTPKAKQAARFKAVPAGGGKKAPAKAAAKKKPPMKKAAAKPVAKKSAPVKTVAKKAAPAQKPSVAKAVKSAPKPALHKALVTGANGFVGSWLARKLHEQGVRVLAPVRPGSDRSRLKGLDIKVIEADINDPEALAGLLGDVDVVFHVAGAIHAYSQEAYDAFNVDASVALARLALRENPRLSRFVYVSSMAATGPSVGQLPRLESSPGNPTTPYGVSKLRGEEALSRIAGLPLTCVRPPIVMGPQDDATEPLYQMAGKGLVLGVLGLERRYSFVNVEDLTEGMIALAKAPAAKGEIFHVCHEDTLSIPQAMELMAETLEARPVKILVPEFLLWTLAAVAETAKKLLNVDLHLDRRRVGEMTEHHWIIDPHKAERLAGFKCSRNLQETIHKAALAYRAEGKA